MPGRIGGHLLGVGSSTPLKVRICTPRLELRCRATTGKAERPLSGSRRVWDSKRHPLHPARTCSRQQRNEVTQRHTQGSGGSTGSPSAVPGGAIRSLVTRWFLHLLQSCQNQRCNPPLRFRKVDRQETAPSVNSICLAWLEIKASRLKGRLLVRGLQGSGKTQSTGQGAEELPFREKLQTLSMSLFPLQSP